MILNKQVRSNLRTFLNIEKKTDGTDFFALGLLCN